MIQNGSVVQIHYTLLVDGEIADQSPAGEPLQFTMGTGHIIIGLEEKLIGKKTGDKLQVTVPPEKAYGFANPSAIQMVPKSTFGEQIKDVKPGAILSGEIDGEPFQACVVDVAADTVTLDLNHPLSGKTLHFDVEIVAVA